MSPLSQCCLDLHSEPEDSKGSNLISTNVTHTREGTANRSHHELWQIIASPKVQLSVITISSFRPSGFGLVLLGSFQSDK